MTKKNTVSRKEPSLSPPLFRLIETPFSVEIKAFTSGEYAITIGGVEKIMLYEAEEMTFKCRGCVLSVLGKTLLCRSFQNGYIEVTGRVESIQLR